MIVLGRGFSSVQARVPLGRSRDLVTLAVKLVTMCAVPALLFRALGSRAVPPGAGGPRRADLIPGIALGIAFLAFQAVFGRGLKQLSEVHPSAATLAWAVAYSIAIISPAGFVFGVLWWRTRSLALLVLLHGWADLLPNLAGFIRTWSG